MAQSGAPTALERASEKFLRASAFTSAHRRTRGVGSKKFSVAASFTEQPAVE